MSDEKQNSKKEAIGWLSLTFVMFLFPALFFFCVFLPMWAGWTTPW